MAPQRGWAGRITNITNIWLIENVLKQQIFSQCQQETLYSIKVWIIDSEIQMTCDSYRSEYLHLRVNLPVDFKSFKGSDNHIVVISSWKYPPSSSILRFLTLLILYTNHKIVCLTELNCLGGTWYLKVSCSNRHLPPAIFSAKSVTIWVKLMGPGASPTRLFASASEIGRPILTKASFRSLAVMIPSLSTSMIPKASLNSWICFWLNKVKMLEPDFLAFFDPFPGWK